jgi:chaperonin GroEL
LTDKKVTNVQAILTFLEHAMKENGSLLIICEDLESEALATLVLNKLRGGLKV